ncbi:unnamed protein product [Cochlearia groenlandica]
MEKNNMRHGDFQEDDVWGVIDQSSFMVSNQNIKTKPSFSNQSVLPSEPRMIPERQSREGMTPMRQHSAPDWSTMVHINKTKKVLDDENVSPEVYFMRRSQSSSVMEGVGRKLKGRDLSKVRNAILKKTGFLE